MSHTPPLTNTDEIAPEALPEISPTDHNPGRDNFLLDPNLGVKRSSRSTRSVVIVEFTQDAV
jgi:hypothetical protein